MKAQHVIAWIMAFAIAATAARVIGRRASRAAHGNTDGAGDAAAVLARLASTPASRVAVFVLVLLVIAAVFAPLLAPFDPLAQPDVEGLRYMPPSLQNLFGTDQHSRDVFSRTIFGTRISLAVAVVAVLASITIGTLYGAVAATLKGYAGSAMMRLVDAMLAIPRVLLLIAVAAIWTDLNVAALALIIGLTGWFGTSRLVRAETLRVNSLEYIAAASAIGISRRRMLLRHVLPNVLSPVIVAATLGLGHVIALEAGLAYLNIGLQPDIPSWGRILKEGSENMGSHWWLWVFPGLSIVTTVMAFNTIGDGLRDAVDPRQLVRKLAPEPG